MCSPARCGRCGKTTWSGCGMHADSVMSRVAPPAAMHLQLNGRAARAAVPVEPKLEHLRRGPVTLGWSNTGNQQVPS